MIDRYGADALRWYFFTSKLPVGRLPLLARDDRRGGAPVPAAAVEHVRVLRPVRERQRGRARDARERRPELPTSTAGSCRGCSATVEIVRERLDDFDATTAGRAIQAFVDELSNWYVRRSRRRFWDGDPAAFATLRDVPGDGRQAARAVQPVPRRRDLRQPRRLASRASTCATSRSPGARDLELERRDGGRARDGPPRASAARGQAKLKVRQPLRAAVIVATGREREAIERLAELVRDELNVHELRFVSEADELGRGRDQAELPHAGPPLRQADAAGGGRGRRPGRGPCGVGAARRPVGINLGRRPRPRADADDLLVTMKPLEGYQVEREGSHAVALELEIDDELRAEGWARDIVRAVQNARQDAGLEITDRIALTLDGDDAAARRRARASSTTSPARRCAVAGRSYESAGRRARPSRSTGASLRLVGVALAGVDG